MRITDIWPTFRQPLSRMSSRQPSWTRSGPGRRHNPLTRKQQERKNQLMNAGLNATQALEALNPAF